MGLKFSDYEPYCDNPIAIIVVLLSVKLARATVGLSPDHMSNTNFGHICAALI
jgi:hypothetical protein